LEEYNKLIENYIQSEKINVFNIINIKNKEITFNSVINDLKNKYEKIESLKRTINYLSATSGDDLNQKVENEPQEKEETDSEKTKREDA
jgi:glucan phosphoethanolaminetransferase (alkaline phosphatase superfamily)